MNDMPVAYQSRAVTEPQREAVSRPADGGVVGTNYGLVSSRLSAARSHQRVTAGTPARRGGYFSVMKSRQKNFI